MTRPARSSSTAGSGMPATTALTAADSIGLTVRTSSREPTVSCSRHGTSAAAAMQMKTATARASERSASSTSAHSASPAANRMMAECRNRSGHGAKKEEEFESSIAMDAGFPSAIREAPATSSGAGVSTLAHIDGGLMPRLGVGGSRQIAQALRSRADDNLPKRQQDYRYDKRANIIEHAEQQHAGEQFLPIHLPEADQHGGIE